MGISLFMVYLLYIFKFYFINLVVSYFHKLGVHRIHWGYAKIMFLAGNHPWVLNKDPTVWLDAASPPPISLIMSWTNS